MSQVPSKVILASNMRISPVSDRQPTSIVNHKEQPILVSDIGITFEGADTLDEVMAFLTEKGICFECKEGKLSFRKCQSSSIDET